MKGKWLLVSVAAVLAAIAAGALSLLRQDRPAPESRPPAAAPAPPLVEAELEGKVEARDIVQVPAPIDGTVEFVAAEPGEDVFEDQLLARVRNTGLESARQAAAEELERAQSRVHNLESVLIAERLESSRASADAGRARLEFERAEKNALRQQMLFREGATPRLVYEKAQKEFESVKAEYEALRTLASRVEDRVSTVVRDLDAGRRVLQEKTEALEAAVADLEAGDVRSPVDGTLLACRAKAGDEVQPSMQDLFQIAIDISRLAVVVEPEPPVLALLEPGMEVEIRIAERPDEAIPGSVAEIDEDLVTIEFSSPGPDVKPGLTARVKIKLR